LVVAVALTGSAASGCTTLKPYEKEYLLNPAMDDDAVQALSSPLAISASATHEKLGQQGGAGAGATACPTCGG
jgi:hypothetical protein